MKNCIVAQSGGPTVAINASLSGVIRGALESDKIDKIYGGKNGTDDYSDDINSRSNMTNWLAGGSVYVPTREGKKVPIRGEVSST